MPRHGFFRAGATVSERQAHLIPDDPAVRGRGHALAHEAELCVIVHKAVLAREHTIQALKEVQPLVAEDAEMAALVQQTIPKMQQLNEQQFKGLELEWHRPEEPEKEKT